MMPLVLAWMLSAPVTEIDNDYVRVTRNAATCAQAEAARCGSRVVVALGAVRVSGKGLQRGDVAVFAPDESFEVETGGDFYEVVVKPGHPPALAPPVQIGAELNVLRHDGEDFFVFEERLQPGATRARHSHSQRVVIQLNHTRLRQWPDGAAEIVVETRPERPTFSPPVVHKVENIGELPLSGIIIEFKPRP
jgi:hypothetical protein